MLKKILYFGLAITFTFLLIIFYLSNFGVKTNNFNSFIKNKIKSYDSRISLKIDEVFLKLNLREFTVKANIKNSNIGIDNKSISLNNVDINLNLIKYLKKKNSIEKIQIITNENEVKDITEFLDSYKFNIARSFIYNQISGGKISAILNIDIDKKNKNNFIYEIKGNVKNTNLNLIGFDNIKKINFDFNIKDKKYVFENILFKYQNINFYSKKIDINKLIEEYEVKGDLNNEKNYIDVYKLSKLTNFNIDILDKKKLLIETENKFTFKIKSNRSIKNLEFKSNLKFDEMYLDKKYQDLIYLKNGLIKTEYKNKDLLIDITSGFSFYKKQNEKKAKNNKDKNIIKLNIVKKNKENIKIKGNLKNKETYINPKVLYKILKIRDGIVSNNEISIKSDNKFSFHIDKNRRIKNLSVKSILNFDKLNLDKKIQNIIYLKNGTVISNYKKNNLNIDIDSGYSYLKDSYKNDKDDKINIKIAKNENKDLKINVLIKNKNNIINSNEFSNYFKNSKKIIKDQDLAFGSDSQISFTINDKNKINNFKIKSEINLANVSINYDSSRLEKIFPKYKNIIKLKNNLINIDFSSNKTEFNAIAEYSFDNKYDKINLEIIKNNGSHNFNSQIEINSNPINFKDINYYKQEDVSSEIIFIGNFFENKEFKFEKIKFLENKNKILLSNLYLSKNLKILDVEKLDLKYLNENKKLNQISILKKNNNFLIKSEIFDGKSIIKNFLKGDSKNVFLKRFENLNSEIYLNFDNFYIDDENYINKIIGNTIIKKNIIKSASIIGKLNGKDDLNLNIKSNSNNEKITKMYIEKPEPFLKNYKFIKGFKEGKLEYNSTEVSGVSKSKLKIYNFKVKEVPLLAKILTLASLQGIADLLTGEGIRFDEFEMDYVKRDKNNTSIEEMYAIGPAISILMEGYIVKNELTSLQGTLVPATTINKSIKKIPLIGDILVGKKLGEGVFGVSFKIKGPPKNLKTTVNPVKTLTPRFITRTLEKIKGN
tara:strand:+ start:3535 stop:6519 length:2985 start_codon:yes stop_codon:yes gene_type:complete